MQAQHAGRFSLVDQQGKQYLICMACGKEHGEFHTKRIVLIGIIGFIFFRNILPWNWLWFSPILILAFIPFIRNLTRSRPAGKKDETTNDQKMKMDSKQVREKQVLEAAIKNNGRLTPALVALDSALSLEAAETMLQSFVKRGYATMEVTESGKLEYYFAEFLPPDKDNLT